MNMSDTATARATANELSELRPPFRDLAFTWSGWPTTFSTSSENERLSRASLKKPRTFSISARSGDDAGQVRLRRGSGSARSARSPRTSKSWPRKW